MKKDVVSLTTVYSMESIRKALDTSHNGFPVINTAGMLVGLINRRMVVVLLEQKAFYSRDQLERPSQAKSRYSVKI